MLPTFDEDACESVDELDRLIGIAERAGAFDQVERYRKMLCDILPSCAVVELTEEERPKVVPFTIHGVKPDKDQPKLTAPQWNALHYLDWYGKPMWEKHLAESQHARLIAKPTATKLIKAKLVKRIQGKRKQRGLHFLVLTELGRKAVDSHTPSARACNWRDAQPLKL